MKFEMDILDFTRNDLGRIRHLHPEGWNDIAPEFEYYLRKPFCYPIKVTIGDLRSLGFEITPVKIT